MKEFKLTAKFYILFSLIFSIPASALAVWIQNIISNLNEKNILKYFADLGVIEVPSAVVILLLLFWLINQWLWRIKGVSKISCIPPDINGRYEGELISSYDETKTYKLVVEIKQTLTDIKVYVYAENSSSYSIVSAIGRNNNDNWQLVYLYQNQTNTVNHDEDMKDHGGAAFLEIFNNGMSLKGNYFNNPRDRSRHGTINVQRTDSLLLGIFK